MKSILPWLLLLSAALVTYCLRRLGQCWGATNREVHQTLPGDEIIPDPMLQTTHAITIRTTRERVWPWVVQLGYYRAGWNTDTAWWDYLVDRYLRFLVRAEAQTSGYGHRDKPSADRIIPEYQQLNVGSVILDGPPGTAFFTVDLLETERLLALQSTTHLRYLFPRAIRDNPRLGIGGEFSWVFILQDAPDNQTRLILRTRGNVRPMLYRLFIDALLPLADGVYARKVLTGVKRRAEAGSNRQDLVS